MGGDGCEGSEGAMFVPLVCAGTRCMACPHCIWTRQESMRCMTSTKQSTSGVIQDAYKVIGIRLVRHLQSYLAISLA